MIQKTGYFWVGALGLLSLGSGCTRHELTLADVDHRMALAVAPALNHSGSQDFDPLRLADLMASELAQWPGVRVIPLNRVLAHLAADGKERIESPAHALQVMERVGADAIVVFAVTEYDPYHPPVMGLTAQLYGIGPERASGFDPVAASRQSSPFEGSAYSKLPRAEYHRVFNSSDEAVQREIRRFALRRNAEESPYGWRKFLASQENFWRFCCAVTTRELIRQEVTQVVALRERNNEVEQP
jgi:hypothetical protein